VLDEMVAMHRSTGPGAAVTELCRLAGADEDLIPQWAEEGRRRRKPRDCLRSADRVGVHCGAADRGCQPAQDGPEPQTWQ
jgi:hypothetical protein